jgi:hypothetical protein
MYINPIEILGLSNAESISNIDIETIKKEKRILFADIDLSDDGFLDYHGNKLTKGDCEKAIDELLNPDIREFYFYLANNNLLNDFLAFGKTAIFHNYNQDSIHKLKEFIEFVSPYYCVQYDKALLNSFSGADELLLKSIVKAPQLFTQSDLNLAYKSLTNLLSNRIVEIDELKNDIEEEQSEYNEDTIYNVVERVKTSFPSSLLNLLPNYFQSQILKIAKSINYLSNSLCIDHTEVSYELTGYLLTINIDGLERPTFENNFQIIKKKHEEKLEQKKNAPLLKRWASGLIQIRELAKQVENISTPSSSALANLLEILDVKELNALPSFADDIRNQIAYAIRSLAISMWNKQEDIKSSIDCINLAIQLNIDSEARLKLNKDLTQLKEIENKNRGIFICHFCEIDRPSKDGNFSKTLYLEGSRTSRGRTHSVSYEYSTIDIPRCSKCKKVHDNGWVLYYLIFFGTIATISLVADFFGVIPEVYWYIALIIGWVLAKLFIKSYYLNKNLKNNSKLELKEHPLLKRKFESGWSFYQPSANLLFMLLTLIPVIYDNVNKLFNKFMERFVFNPKK